eukprot:comp12375_c0_seq1/m.7267 comp12375_c0_seq1/g.7267  ORF comp12375_c0_seq1/g.7267 comp12375_c0_seq1/m.7267 type:complete len:162 (-) comp12375_c0_seq1:520-1005(-)
MKLRTVLLIVTKLCAATVTLQLPGGPCTPLPSVGTPFERLGEEAKKNITCIYPAQAKAVWGKGALFLDVMEQSEFATNSILGSTNIPRGVLERDIYFYVDGYDAPIITFCAAGIRGALTARTLQELGFTNVRSLDGGFKAWQAQGYPMSQVAKNSVPFYQK